MVKVYIGSNSGVQDYDFDLIIPELKNQSPYPNETNVPINEDLLTFDVVDYSPTLISLSSIDAYIDGYLAFSGGTFYPPFNAGSEYYSAVSVSGQDGYKVVLDYSGLWSPSSTHIFRVLASNTAGTLDEYWSFTTSDFNPLEIKNQSPYPNETNVAINKNLLTFDVVDFSPTFVDFSSIDAYIDGYLAFSGGTFYPPFNAGMEGYSNISISGQDGYRIVLDYSGNWSPSSTHIFRALASNTAGTLDEYWNFIISDFNPPEIKDLVPLANSARNDRLNRYIDLTIFSPENTIIFKNSLQVYINNELALLNNTFLDPFNGPDGYINSTADGYRVRVDCVEVPWNSYKSIGVRALAEDAYGFSLDETYNYRIEDIRAPANVSTPIANQTDVDKDVNLTFQLFDRGCGVKQSEIKIYINSVLAYDGSTNSFNVNYSGPSSSIVANTYDGYDGYYIVIDPVNSFDSGSTVSVQVIAKDNEGN